MRLCKGIRDSLGPSTKRIALLGPCTEPSCLFRARYGIKLPCLGGGHVSSLGSLPGLTSPFLLWKVAEFYQSTVYPVWHYPETFGFSPTTIFERMRRQYPRFEWPYGEGTAEGGGAGGGVAGGQAGGGGEGDGAGGGGEGDGAGGGAANDGAGGDAVGDGAQGGRQRVLIAGAGSGHQVAQSLVTLTGCECERGGSKPLCWELCC